MLPQCINQKTHFSHEFFKWIHSRIAYSSNVCYLFTLTTHLAHRLQLNIPVINRQSTSKISTPSYRFSDWKMDTFYCGGPWIWGWQNCTSRAQKLEPHLLVKVHSASAPWLNHCRSQYNIRLAAEIDIVIFEWQQEGVGKQRLSNSCLKTGAGKAEVEQ